MTCFEPSGRLIVPMRLSARPSPGAGSSTVIRGGQAKAQPPAQLETLRSSLVNRYSERPAASIRMVPKAPFSMAFTGALVYVAPPSVVTTNQTPPTSCPMVSPGFSSLA